jgi:hypothetical protein
MIPFDFDYCKAETIEEAIKNLRKAGRRHFTTAEAQKSLRFAEGGRSLLAHS